MYDHHVFGFQYLVDGFLLRLVQPRQAYVAKLICACRLSAVEEVAQLCQSVVACSYHSVQCLEHKAIGSLVERKLNAEVRSAILKGSSRRCVGNDHHHPVAVGNSHGGREPEIADSSYGMCGIREEYHRASILEVVLYLLLRAAEYLDTEHVERIVERATHVDIHPCIAPMHSPAYAHSLGLLGKSLFLGGILQFEQQPLPLESFNRLSCLKQ